MSNDPDQAVTPDPADALVERLFGAFLAAVDIVAVHLGDRLGYYRALADGGPATSVELAGRTGTAERYAREWLEQQAVTGILAVEDAKAPAIERRFRLPDGYEAVLVDPDSLLAMAPMARVFAGLVAPLPRLLDAFRTGEGVPYTAYGPDMHVGLADAGRAEYLRSLAHEWLPTMPDVHARLLANPPARVADVGMGLGWSSIAVAQGYPNVLVDGFDMDLASVEAARANAQASGVADRVTFHVRDAGDPELAGAYDLAMAVECIHDMSNPVGVLGAMRRLVGVGGTVLVIDEKVADRFEAPGDDVERLMYGFSVLHCLPVGMAEQPSAATGTVMRESTFRRYAEEAGFQDIEVLPIEHGSSRFYRLTA